jgi:hypothetical protein
MKVQFLKWDNSLPLRVPKVFARVVEICRLLLVSLYRFDPHIHFLHLEKANVFEYLRGHWGIVQR